MSTKIRESINRGNNLMVVGLFIPLGIMVVVSAIMLYRTREKAGLSQAGSLPEMESGQGMRN